MSEPLVKKRAAGWDTMLGQGSTCSVLGPMGRGRVVVAMDTAVTQSSCCWTSTSNLIHNPQRHLRRGLRAEKRLSPSGLGRSQEEARLSSSSSLTSRTHHWHQGLPPQPSLHFKIHSFHRHQAFALCLA